MEKRKHKRYKIIYPVKTLEGDGEFILDLSRTGCKLRSFMIYPLGELILITKGKHFRIGEIMWKDNKYYGIKFSGC